MSLRGLAPILTLLLICFSRESFSICDRSLWTKVGWEIFPEEMYYLKVKPPPAVCLPYPLDKLCCNFANVDIFQGCLQLIYISAQGVFLILSVLSVHYLWMKWKKHKEKLKKQASFEILGNDLKGPAISDIDQILCKLMAITSLMTKYLNQVAQHTPPKKVKQRKLKSKKKQGGAAKENQTNLYANGAQPSWRFP